MNNNRPDPFVLPDPQKIAADHRKQILWQIWVPLGGVALVILALAVLASVSTAQGSELPTRWSQISTIFLIIPLLGLGLVILLLVSALAYGVIRLIPILPVYSKKARMFLNMVSQQVRLRSDQAVAPILTVKSTAASWSSFWGHFKK